MPINEQNRRRNSRCLWKGFAGGVLLLLAFGAWWIGWYDNYHIVLPNELYRSGQMSAATLSHRIASDGLRTVINLRPETNQVWHASERKICDEHGVLLIDFPLLGNQAPTTEQTAALVAILSHVSRPLLIHCQYGADRTSFATALYLSQIARVPAARARTAFSLRYGHLAFTRVGCFDRAFNQFLKD